MPTATSALPTPYPTEAPALTTPTRPAFLHFEGAIEIPSNEASVDPAEELDFGMLLRHEFGDYRLQLLASNGAELAGIDFDLTVFPSDYGISPPYPLYVGPGYFQVSVRKPFEPIASVAIRHKGWLIWEKKASLHVPTISFITPTGGEKFYDPEITFEWIGEDADGDLLHYSVAYSLEDGRTWQYLVFGGYQSSSITRENLDLKGSTKARIKVLASDGINIGTAISNRFEVANVPVVNIRLPYKDFPVFRSRELVLGGYALDVEEGYLTNGVS